MTAPGRNLLCSLVFLVLACTQLQIQAHRSIAEFYESLPASDQEALSKFIVSSPAFKRKSPVEANFLRFGKRAVGNELLLQGKEPNFLRFGKRADPLSNNFLRFGRSEVDNEDPFARENRKPNFLRFGR